MARNLTRLIDIERLTHSIKTAIACIIGFVAAYLFGFSHGSQWIVVTIVVVMCAQIFVGGMIHRAWLRFLGTLIGCIFAITMLLALGDTSLSIIAAIAFSSFIFSYLATGQEDLSYAGTLGAATTAIIMLGQPPTIAVAGLRFVEISIGILIATLVSQFILPINARTHLRRAQAITLEQLRDYYIDLVIILKNDQEASHAEELDESIIKSISKQRQLAKDSAREKFGKRFDSKHFVRSLYCEREMLRAIDFMHRALINIKSAKNLFAQSTLLHTFNDSIVQSLNTLIKTLESAQTRDVHIHIPPIASLKEEVQMIASQADASELTYINGFLFSAETLASYLIELAELFKITIFDKN